MKYIIDTDPGIDDAIGIILAYQNKLDIIGFTLATGNIDKKMAANNLKLIQNVLGSNIPMYYGTLENKSNMISAEYAHGSDGLGNIFMPEIKKDFENISAEDFIIESANNYENNLTIICLGPLTNLASAIKKDKSIVNKISKVIVMGGSYDKKIDVPYNEFNFKIDIDSASLVLNSRFKDIRMISHEIGVKSFIKKDDMEKLRTINNKISKFIYIISQKYMEFSKEHYDVIGCCMPDPTTIASVINEDIIKYVPCTINLKDDLVYITKTDTSNIHVSSDINLKLFRELFNNTFLQGE